MNLAFIFLLGWILGAFSMFVFSVKDNLQKRRKQE